jgi:hypothetical protein
VGVYGEGARKHGQHRRKQSAAKYGTCNSARAILMDDINTGVTN